MTREPIEVFLTGATGFLGHYVLAELLAHPHIRCRVLLRSPVSESSARLDRLLADIGLNLSALIADGRVAEVEGELPDSLRPADISGVDLVLHAAGNTTFHANGSGEPAKTNVDGTRAMLLLAADVKIRRFAFVSTAYVCGEQVGHLPEVFFESIPPIRNDYERSKWEAERLVWDWGKRSGVATICRPSILFGDSRTGRASAMKGLYLVARATEILARAMDGNHEADRHQISLRVLGLSHATCNVVPIDWAARQIANISLEPAAESSVHHVTNPDPPTHQEVKQWLEEFFDITGGQFSNATWPLEDANHYEDLFYSLGNICLDYFRHGLTFESRCAASIPSQQRLIDRESFFRCMKYAQATNWCRNRCDLDNLHPPAGLSACVHAQAGRIDSKWYFEEFLPWAVPRSTVAEMKTLTTVVRFIVDGDFRGEWVCRFDAGRLVEVHRGGNGVVEEFGYRMTSEAFHGIVTGRTALQAVFFEGGADITGNTDRALRMVPIMSSFLKEFPAGGGQTGP